jgi:hypothetical protein
MTRGQIGDDIAAIVEAAEEVRDPKDDLVERAKSDPGAPFEPVEIAMLRNTARNCPADFERLRARLRAETKVRLPALEAVMKAAEPEAGADDGMAGRPISYEEIEPWEEAVNGGDLLSELSEAIGSYIVMDKPQRDAVALWAVFAHAHDLRDYAPPLIIVSPLKRCGKTRLQETLARLVPKPQPTSGVTAALFPRLIERHRPTLLIDEFDAMARGDKDMAEILRGLLDSSFNKRSAVVLKLVPLPGGGYEPRQFSTWAPTCIAGIGTISDTVEDRSVIVRLVRKLIGEVLKRLRDKDGSELDTIKRKIARWVDDNELRLRQAAPTMPKALNDRQADAWDPLLAIAEVAGGDWPKLAREGALSLCRADEAEAVERDTKITLLRDIRDIFVRLFPKGDPAHEAERIGRPDDGPRLLTKQLLGELQNLEERPWAAWGRAKKLMTGTDLALLLRPYRIRSDTVRSKDAMGNSERGKGYYLRSFKDAFSRYLPLSEPSSRDGVTNPANAGEIENSEGVTNAICHGSQNAGDTSKTSLCHGVTDPKGRKEGEDEKGRVNGALRGDGSPDSHRSPGPQTRQIASVVVGAVSTADIVEKARRCGVSLTLDAVGTGLSLAADSKPPPEIVDHHRQPVVEAFLSAEKEPERWRRILAEKVETIVKVRGLERPDAERAAFRHIVIEFANATHPNTDPRVCAWCNKPSLPLAPALAFGSGDRHAYLHQHCQQPWSARRQNEVVTTLAGMGIVEPGANVA